MLIDLTNVKISVISFLSRKEYAIGSMEYRHKQAVLYTYRVTKLKPLNFDFKNEAKNKI